ncbi:GNAT family N-acetyltransferase [Chitinophaga nivalis]|uniref:GNAT family N-acetyltransferase n=1 Tax=Chitinophaga nivalis TaxID=2991709 RepID=A0ABT3IKS5_9BACT|nr:GNAT family N-acetyltransferase [Chitinophaga nivalis]MCW3465745.1 GNAT family N-acetyltransferase [Chitinophaga nivalis]MCW3484564.1 GNAT family N-acetyltransferase [Chitinophaga nivalis]
MDKYLFTSPRLGFRHWQDSDTLPFTAMGQDAAVMQYFPQLMTAEATAALIMRIQTHFREKGYGLYATDLLSTGTFIGFIGFSTPSFPTDFTPCTEIGWRLQSAVWGQGLATEGARACLEYGFRHFHFPAIYSFTAVQNQRSEKVMQKIGMHQVGLFDHPLVAADSSLQKHVLYKITQSDIISLQHL